MFRYFFLGFRFLFLSAGSLRVGGSRFSRDDAALLNSVMDDDAGPARVYTRAREKSRLGRERRRIAATRKNADLVPRKRATCKNITRERGTRVRARVCIRATTCVRVMNDALIGPRI
jgi:hypothetical protein